MGLSNCFALTLPLVPFDGSYFTANISEGEKKACLLGNPITFHQSRSISMSVVTTTDQTINIQFSPTPLTTISVGVDGEALIGEDGLGRHFELRTLSTASLTRIDEIRHQLTYFELLDDRSIRESIDPLDDNDPPAFGLAIAAGIDPVSIEFLVPTMIAEVFAND